MPFDAETLIALAQARHDRLVAMTQAMVRIDSQTPPSDTGAMARLTADYLRAIEGVDVQIVESVAPVFNVIATLDGGAPGPRLVLSGHLDTYPIGDATAWRHDPLGGTVAEGLLYGRGSADMKGGVAVLIEALRMAAERMRPFAGSVVLVLAGDEERMGELGTQWLIDHMPQAVRGDAVMVADVGGPRALRLGEKGMIWLDLWAEGQQAHGAHVQAGVNAADRLIDAITALRTLERIQPETPADAAAVMAEAAALPHADPPAARAVMQRVTVNLGQMSAGISPNLVPARAQAGLDIRLPLGATVARTEERLEALLRPIPGLGWTITRRYEPTWTPAHTPIARAALKGARQAADGSAWADMRIGGSDARLWRRAGMDCVVLGLSPRNLGAPDEALMIDELSPLLAAYGASIRNYLTGG
ncbi:M20/M25/M40 family metallo-hydrolase [Rhodobacteraceae bacterium 2376]|uniref:M20/M25/M40 family metallo-hydrolase n=1 Tax=Rhabdonatronobacter sediminivivens TaxID=2743469 RepID=A0A7Z0I1A4_9RHOB|nr:M20/M25/M40 family metallo-hydrolase [Rhabdonatronobacter sediminivivens]NYS26115.1 M20/M25/M40 family metallo-hydrolase [Rhabdonatronobacter sediminivivens]